MSDYITFNKKYFMLITLSQYNINRKKNLAKNDLFLMTFSDGSNYAYKFKSGT